MLPMALAVGLLVTGAAPDLHVTSAEADRAVGDASPAVHLGLREPPAQPTWFSPFSRYEKLAQLTMLGLGVVDWGQTIRFTQGAGYAGYEEANPVLGRHPSRARVNAYFVLALGLHALGAWALPPPYRDVLLLGGIAVEADAVASNAVQGIEPTMPWR